MGRVLGPLCLAVKGSCVKFLDLGFVRAAWPNLSRRRFTGHRWQSYSLARHRDGRDQTPPVSVLPPVTDRTAVVTTAEITPGQHPQWCVGNAGGCTGSGHRSAELTVPGDAVAGV